MDEIKLNYHAVVYNSEFQRAFNDKIIKIVAPASGTSDVSLSSLEAIPGLVIDMPLDIQVPGVMYHSNSDDQRFEQLKSALYDDSFQTVIWALRGGYGSARLIDRLLLLPKPCHEKTFIGFSDITALHLFFSAHWGWRTIHASGFVQLLDTSQKEDNYLRLADLIAKRVKIQIFNQLRPLNQCAKQLKTVHGVMQGGNLTLVESSIGTAWEIKTAGSILFLEEVGEKGYRIDRTLNHLRQAGLFNGVQAVVFGECSGPDTEGISVAIARFADETTIPVYQTPEFGHLDMNYPIVYGAVAEINAIKGDIVLTMQVQ